MSDDVLGARQPVEEEINESKGTAGNGGDEQLTSGSVGRGTTKKFVLAVLIFGVGLFIGRYLLPAGELKEYSKLKFITVQQGERQFIFPTFWEAWDKLHANFIGNLEENDLFYGAVEGMVRAAGDPYTVFAPPADTKQFEETIKGSFGGVGIEIGMDNNGVVKVIAPIEGSPAQQAGVREGDVILAIDDEMVTADMGINDVVQRIRGENGTEVKLTVFHKEATRPAEVSVVRGTIQVESVKLRFIEQKEKKIAYVAITNFNSDTANKFNQVVRQIKKEGAVGIIVDVRNNPGGFLQSAVEIASRWVEPGKLVVAEKGKKNKDYNAQGNTLLQGMPTVIIVNGGSASAAEILTGALYDQLDVPIVGVKTFGKGSVQEFMKLSDGSSLKVTIAKWYTPRGRSINEEGIEPTIEVKQDFETEEDEQLNRAVEEVEKLIDKQ